MLLRQMQIDGCYFEITVSEQYLDGAQVGASFEKMCGEAMPQGMWVNVLMCEAGAFGGNLAGTPQHLGGDRITCGVPAVAGKESLLWLAPESAPVCAQFFEELRAEHDIAIPAALALSDMNHHPLAVDVADLQVGSFCATCAGGV